MATGKTIYKMVLGSIFGWKIKAKANYSETGMKDNGKTVKDMVTVHFIMLMDQNMKGNGKII